MPRQRPAPKAGYEPFIDHHRKIARAVIALHAKRQDGEGADAWDLHCSDHDTLWEQMILAALYPESYPGEDAPYKAMELRPCQDATHTDVSKVEQE
jgi:poly(3-hydroxybutyrate) depolymerase